MVWFKRKKNCKKITGVNTAIFCHDGGFVGSAKTLMDMRAIGIVPKKKGYSGTAVFTKIKPKKVEYGIGIEEHDKEGRVITLEFEKFYLVNIYTPNSKRELERLRL